MKKFFGQSISIILIIGMIFSFAACGSNTSNTSKQKDTNSKKQEEVKKEKQVVKGIVLNDVLPKLQFLIDDLEKENSNIKYDFETVEFAQLDKKINLAHASGEDYDFFEVNNSSVPQFYMANVLAPLNEYMKKSNIDPKLIASNESLLSNATIEGKTYALPYAPDCRVLAYNKKMLDEAGLEPPKTIEDILEISEQLAKDGVYAYTRRFDSPLPTTYNDGCFMMGFGAHLYVKDGDSYKSTCDTPEMIEFVNWSKELAQYMPKDVNINDSQCRQMFAQGKNLFYIYGPWEFNLDIDKNMKLGTDYDLITVPGKVKSGSTMGGWYLGIGNGGKSKDGAWKLLSKIMEPENLAKATVALPGDSRAYQYAPFNDPKYKIFSEQMKTAEIPMPPVAQFNKINEVYCEYFNKVLMSDMETEDAMKKANEQIQKLLDNK